MTVVSIPGFQDPVASLTHLVGAVVVLVRVRQLVRRGGDHRGRRIAVGVFGVSAALVLLASGFYHQVSTEGPAREIMQRLDHAAIFGLIAGTFTPIQFILFDGAWRWGGLSFMWGAAATGVTVKSVYFSQLSDALSLSIYLAVGWAGLASFLVLWKRFGFAFICPVLFGGLAYTFGAVLDHYGLPVLLDGVVGPHEFFHLAVLLGVTYHWVFIHRIAAGEHPTR